MAICRIQGIQFSDEDVVEPEKFFTEYDNSYHKHYGWLFHDHGFTVCVVCAPNLQDALDEAVDNDKFDRYQVDEANMDDYGEDEDGISRLGNASEPFDIESLHYIQFELTPPSVARQFNSSKRDVVESR